MAPLRSSGRAMVPPRPAASREHLDVSKVVSMPTAAPHGCGSDASGGKSMIRVVQWATGLVGRHAAAAVVDHPDLELVGAYVYNDDKAGRDVGDICGFAPTGVIATRDRGEILALAADCVLYMAQGDANTPPAIDDICALLASGKNVVSTAVTPLIWPQAMGPGVVDRIQAACTERGTSFHATG